jgi:arylsulfatase A-like enzyme
VTRGDVIRLGAIIGLVCSFALFVYDLITSGGFAVMGVKNEILSRVVRERYVFQILLDQTKAAGVFAVMGLALGSLTGLGAALVVKRPTRRRTVAVLVMGGLAVLHLYFYARGIILTPPLYTEWLYDRGGAGRWMQVFLTDRLSLAGLHRAGLLVLFLIGSWIVWRALPKRIPAVRWQMFGHRLAGPVGAASALGLLAAVTVIGLRFVPMNASSSVGRLESHRPNVVMIVVDSLRYDHLSCHGYARATTPQIDGLCREGIDFDRAYVSLPRTFPSLVTLLTGLYPERHGVRHMFPRAVDRNQPLPGLPRALTHAGYQSRAISDFSGDVLTRVDLGFDRVQSPYFNFPMLLKMRGLEIHRHLLPYLRNGLGRRIFPELREFVQASDPALLGDEARKAIHEMRDQPFFLTVFFSTPHFPYAAPFPDYERFTESDYRGSYKYHKPNLITTREIVADRDAEHIRALYDGAVYSVDRQVGRIREALKREGVAERTIVIVTADHGEHLYEYGEGMGHGEHLRGDGVLRVPLIIRDPLLGRPHESIQAAVRSVDLLPTLLDRLGVEDPVDRDGVSLMPLLLGEKDDLGLPVFAETGIWFVESGPQFFQRQRLEYPDVLGLMEIDPDRGDEIVLKEKYRDLIESAKHRMVIRDGYKLISIPTRRGVRYEMYDHASDPEDRHPLDQASHRAVFESLQNELLAWMARDPRTVVRNGYLLPAPAGWTP